MKLINLQLNAIISATNILCGIGVIKYPLEYQLKYLPHLTIFTEYRCKTTSKGALPRKIVLQMPTEKK